jgi:hypothetical protein
MKNILIQSKNFVVRNKTTLIVGATLSAVIVLQGRGLNAINDFLKEKELYNEYYLGNES